MRHGNVPNQHSADANLLFGVLALQMDFITREQLIAGMQAWVNAKTTPLAEHLVRLGALKTDDRAALEPLIAAHLRRHGGDAEKSLASISSAGILKQDLHRIADADVQHSLRHLVVAGIALITGQIVDAEGNALPQTAPERDQLWATLAQDQDWLAKLKTRQSERETAYHVVGLRQALAEDHPPDFFVAECHLKWLKQIDAAAGANWEEKLQARKKELAE